MATLIKGLLILSAVFQVLIICVICVIITLAISRVADRNMTLIIPTNSVLHYALWIVTIIAIIVSFRSTIFTLDHYEEPDTVQAENVVDQEKITELPGIVDTITTDTGTLTRKSKTEARIVLDDDRGVVYCNVHFGQLCLQQPVIVGATESGRVIYLTYNGQQYYIDYGE